MPACGTALRVTDVVGECAAGLYLPGTLDGADDVRAHALAKRRPSAHDVSTWA